MNKELTQEQMNLILCLLKKYDSKIITQKIWDELNFDFSKNSYTRKANKSNFPIKIGYSFEEFDPRQHSSKIPIQIRCKQCNAIYVTMLVKFSQRTYSDELLCKACYSKVIFSSERWKKANSDAQERAKKYSEPLECIKTCIVCGNEFTILLKKSSGSGCKSPTYKNICSKECHYKHNRLLRDVNIKTNGKIEKKCVICGKLMYVYPSQSSGFVTCSKECSIKNRKINTIKIKVEKRNCLHCQKEFEVKETSKRKYCSHECNSLHRKNGVEKACIICGKLMYLKKSMCERKCCSKQCQNVAQSNGIIQGYVNSRGGYRLDIENSPYFKSSFEADFYRYCKYIGKNIIYESKTFTTEFNGIVKNYTPDFYDVDKQKFIELKGLERGDSLRSKQINSNSDVRDKLINEGIDIEVVYMKDFYDMLKDKGLYDLIFNIENKDYKATKCLVRNHLDEAKK